MITLREAAQQALEALEWHYRQGHSNTLGGFRLKIDEKTIRALRAALSQETQTPCDIAEDGVCEVIDCCRNWSQILEALEIGYDSAQAEAAQYHAAMAGYRPERHAAMDADVQKIAKAITALRDALAQEEQEPLLVVEQEPDYMSRGHFYEGSKPFIDPTEVWKLPIGTKLYAHPGTKLYTHPPRREWQGLSEDENNELSLTMVKGYKSVNWLSRAIEAKLKEKNNA